MKWLGFDKRVQREGVIAASVWDIVATVYPRVRCSNNAGFSRGPLAPAARTIPCPDYAHSYGHIAPGHPCRGRENYAYRYEQKENERASP